MEITGTGRRERGKVVGIEDGSRGGRRRRRRRDAKEPRPLVEE